jgi:hypothetical protein
MSIRIFWKSLATAEGSAETTRLQQAFVTHLQRKMLDEIQRRNDSQNTICTCLTADEDSSTYFHRACFECRKLGSGQRSILTSLSLPEV